LADLEGQYCNSSCIGCSTSSLATASLSCYQNLRFLKILNLRNPVSQKSQLLCINSEFYAISSSQCDDEDKKSTVIPSLRAKAGIAVARLSHRNSVCPSVCHLSGSVRNGAS